MEHFHFILLMLFIAVMVNLSQSSSSLSLPPMKIDASKIMKTSLCFGSNMKCFEMVLNPSSYYTWVSDVNHPQRNINKFDTSLSQTCRVFDTQEFFLGSIKMKGNVIEDSLTIDNFSMPKFRFLSVFESDDEREMDGMLGLGFLTDHQEEDHRFSFVHQLAYKQLIPSSVFVIEMSGNNGWLNFGRVPIDILRDYYHYGYCRINTSAKMQHDSAWTCNVRSLAFGKDYDPNSALNFDNLVAKFDFTSKQTIVPIKHLLQLEKIYFEKAIESGDCNFGIKNGYYTYTCLTNELPSFTEISLVFDDWIIHVPMGDLFTYDQTDNEYEFIIYNKDGLNEFVIGMNIMKNYRMVFDESNSFVGFYNADSKYVSYIGQGPLQPPKIPDDNGGLQPGNSKDKDGPLQPPVKEPIDGRPVPIPEQKTSFFQKFFMFIGIMSLIVGVLFFVWLAFRYYRRKKYNDPSFYYKATDDFFQNDTRIE